MDDTRMFLGICLYLSSVISIIDAQPGIPDSIGTQFVLVVDYDRGYEERPEILLSTMENHPVSTTVREEPMAGFSVTGDVVRGQASQVFLENRHRCHNIPAGNRCPFTLIIETDGGQIAVQLLNYAVVDSSATTILPLDVLGLDYTVVGVPYYISLFIIAIEANTQFWITPTTMLSYQNTDHPAGETFTESLSDEYDGVIVSQSTQEDATGTHITSDKPIAVFSGCYRAIIDEPNMDMQFTQLYPGSGSGDFFVVVGMPQRYNNDHIRMVTELPYVVVLSITTGEEYVVTNYQAAEFRLLRGDARILKASSPIQVFQMMEGFGDLAFDGATSMNVVPTVKQYFNQMVFSVGDSEHHYQHIYLTIIIPSVHSRTGVILDDRHIAHGWADVGLGDYWFSYIQQPIEPGSHELWHVDGSAKMMGIVSAIHKDTGYSMAVGSAAFALNEECTASATTATDGLDNDCDGLFDEELENGKDDDGDGRIDEDLTWSRRHGQLTQWSEWDCICLDQQQSRDRSCDPTPRAWGFECIGHYYEQEYCDCNECLSNPCQNGATCNDELNYYTCSCEPGFTGYNCETDIDECSSSPCENGTCVDGVNGYLCDCISGFDGVHCQSDRDECDSDPCNNGGTCLDLMDEFVCQCTPGYTGLVCEFDYNCISDPCQNDAVCEDQSDGYICHCSTGFIGDHCQSEIQECSSNPCSQDGYCKDMVGAYSCVCHMGYTGKHCEEKISTTTPTSTTPPVPTRIITVPSPTTEDPEQADSEGSGVSSTVGWAVGSSLGAVGVILGVVGVIVFIVKKTAAKVTLPAAD